MMKASISIESGAGAETLARALIPESDEEIPRTRTDVSGRNGELRIDIEAEDLIALRAAINSYLRWAKLAVDTRESTVVIK